MESYKNSMQRTLQLARETVDEIIKVVKEYTEKTTTIFWPEFA